MDEVTALNKLKKKDEKALCWFIDRYTPYVSTIVWNIIGESMTSADVEEVVSDVFLTLWKNCGKVRFDKVKGWLSAVARNKALEKTRQLRQTLSLEGDIILISNSDPQGELESREQARLVRKTILALEQPDREIFLRHYYYCQPLSRIAEEMDMNLSTVKTRLRRGRKKLRDTLNEGGYEVEDI